MRILPSPAHELERMVMRMVRQKRALPEMMGQVERWLVAEVLRAHGWNKTKAAAALGITREGMHKKLARLHLRPPPREREIIKNKSVIRVVPTRTFKGVLLHVERWLIAKALRDHGGNRTRAAVALGVTRETVHHKLLTHDLEHAPRKLDSALMRVVRQSGTLKDRLHAVERWLMTKAVRNHRGNKTKAAAALGVAREAIYRKLGKRGAIGVSSRDRR
jgi:DNA-binding NtrC family response regulator